MLRFTEKLESQMTFSGECVYVKALLEVFTRLSGIPFHLLQKFWQLMKG